MLPIGRKNLPMPGLDQGLANNFSTVVCVPPDAFLLPEEAQQISFLNAYFLMLKIVLFCKKGTKLMAALTAFRELYKNV